MEGRTTFVIAHRLATIRNADRIFVFDAGEIVEQGSFDELVAKDGRFAALARAQFMAAEESAEEGRRREREQVCLRTDIQPGSQRRRPHLDGYFCLAGTPRPAGAETG